MSDAVYSAIRLRLAGANEGHPRPSDRYGLVCLGLPGRRSTTQETSRKCYLPHVMASHKSFMELLSK
jgi:hypothetical protein